MDSIDPNATISGKEEEEEERRTGRDFLAASPWRHCPRVTQLKANPPPSWWLLSSAVFTGFPWLSDALDCSHTAALRCSPHNSRCRAVPRACSAHLSYPPRWLTVRLCLIPSPVGGGVVWVACLRRWRAKSYLSGWMKVSDRAEWGGLREARCRG